MAKIKNDPRTYVRRSDLDSSGNEARVQALPVSRERAQEFLSAEMDERFYVDLRARIAAS